jgi:glutathionylspermidine synthase
MEMHMQFHELNTDWLNTLRRHGALIEASGAVEQTRRYLASKGAADEPYLPIPLLMDKAQFEEVAQAGRLLLRAQGKILSHLAATLGRSGLCQLFEVPSAIQPFVDWDNLIDGHNLVVRFDVVPSSDGYRFCEINCDSTVAGFELFECQKRYGDALGWPLSAQQRAPHEDICRLFRRLTQRHDLRRVLVCDWSCYRSTSTFAFDFLHEALQQSLPGVDVRMAYEDDFPEDWLQPGQGRDLLVYRGFMQADMNDGGRFIQRICDSGAMVINTFETEIRSNKGWFALLHDAALQPLLDAQELQAVRRFVPHTVALRPDNTQALLASKDRHVFKLNCSSGGRGVYFGSEHSAEELRAVFARNGSAQWTAQAPIDSSTIELPASEGESAAHRLVLGLFLVDGQASGVNVRASRHSRVVNVSLGVASCLWASPTTPEIYQTLLSRLASQSLCAASAD